MKLMLIDYAGYAFAADLSVELARRGWRVTHVYTSASGSPQGELSSRAGVEFVDVEIGANPKADFIRRWSAEHRFGLAAAELVRNKKPQIVMAADTPLEALRRIAAACRRRRIPFVLWWQDILSDAMESILRRRFGAPGRGVACYYRGIEKRCLRDAAAVIAVSPHFVKRMEEWGVPTAHAGVIPNWAPVEHITPLNKDNRFTRRYGLVDSFVLLYSGTLGMKQNPQLIVDAAKYLATEKDVRLAVVSEGVAMPFLQQEKQKHRLDNLLLLPLQPYRELPEVLAGGDVHLVLLSPEAARFCVPSKVWASFCAARPLVAVLPEDNDAARVIREIGAGIVSANADGRSLAEAVLRLRNDPLLRQQMGAAGRRYAETFFRIEKAAERFESMLKQTAESIHRNRG